MAKNIILRVDKGLWRKMFGEKKRLDLNWEQYIAHLFHFKEGTVTLA